MHGHLETHKNLKQGTILLLPIMAMAFQKDFALMALLLAILNLFMLLVLIFLFYSSIIVVILAQRLMFFEIVVFYPLLVLLLHLLDPIKKVMVQFFWKNLLLHG